jgi:uncharacterized protein
MQNAQCTRHQLTPLRGIVHLNQSEYGSCIVHCAFAVSPFVPTSTGASCLVRVTPGAGRTGIGGVRDGQLIVKLAAAPVDGAANEALVAALSESFGLPRRAVTITAGQRSRTKRVEFAGVTPTTLAARLAALLHD